MGISIHKDGALPFQQEALALRTAVQGRLEGLFAPGANLVEDAMHAAVTAPGKRLRPVMTMLAARDLGEDGPAALEAGCALELVHTASLLLDDLPCMDDATLRRGRPALHITHGEDVAILAAIALLARAYGMLAAAPGLSGAQRAELAAILSAAVGPEGLVGGQLADLRGAGSVADAADTNHRKTGALFVAALEMACVIGDASSHCRGRFQAFGRELGQAFQLMDDLADATATPARLGKDTRKDAGKANAIHFLGQEGGRERLAAHVEGAITALDGMDRAGGRLRQLVRYIFAELSPVPVRVVAAERRRGALLQG